MGYSSFSRDDYTARSTMRSSTAKSKGIDPAAATFAYDYSIKTGAIAAAVHDSLSPKGLTMRECRDSDAHPVTVPVGIILDTTGSMAEVPKVIQAALPKLMSAFLDAKASGKKYLDDGYPSILISAVDDFDAMNSSGWYSRSASGAEGCLQFGQFESGIEIDDNLTNLWLTGRGGGTNEESYDLALYAFAKHTVHDHYDKRGKKGHIFIIGDEQGYNTVSKEQIKAVIGDVVSQNMTLAALVKEVQTRYNVYFVIPNMTQNYRRRDLEEYWVKLLGQQNVLHLEDPTKICELIVATVAVNDGNVDVDDLSADLGVDKTFSKALVPLSKSRTGGTGAGSVSKYSISGLPSVPGKSAGIDRL